MKHVFILALAVLLVLPACNPSPEQQAAMTSVALTATATSWTLTPTPTITATATITLTPSVTPTPMPSETPTATLTPTFDFPDVIVNTQAHCRYGPSKAHLHAADLYPGDTGTVRGRFVNSSWLYVKFDKLNYFCWIAPSVAEVQGDITMVQYTLPNLPKSSLYKPPKNVQATRQGNQVVVTWDPVAMTADDDRGYFIEAYVCQNGLYLWTTVAFENQNQTRATFNDQAGCAYPSSGLLYAVEKHGYTEPATIPWPPAKP